MNDVQQAIAEIAYRSNHQGITMTMSELRDELESCGLKAGKKRGLYKQVSTAYQQALDEGNDGVARDIAMVFLNDDGEYQWDN